MTLLTSSFLLTMIRFVYLFASLLILTASACKPPGRPSRSVFSLKERTLIPEGIAYDPGTGSFYISSIYERKVVRRSKNGSVSDFVASREYDLGSALGMEVDARRGLLWVCSYTGARGGSNALYAFDLKTGVLKKKLTPPGASREHLPNDVELAADGAIYITDTMAGEVYVLAPGSDSLAVFVPKGHFQYPNGNALSTEHGVMFVADDLGITAIDLKSRQPVRLQTAPGLDVRGIDGLYLHGDRLMAIQNSSPDLKPRILSIAIEKDPWRITALDVLEDRPDVLDMPTTGVVVGPWLYFIAESQLPELNQETGEFRNPGELTESEIRRVR